MPVDQSGELFEGLQPLPFELGLPVLKELPTQCRLFAGPTLLHWGPTGEKPCIMDSLGFTIGHNPGDALPNFVLPHGGDVGWIS